MNPYIPILQPRDEYPSRAERMMDACRRDSRRRIVRWQHGQWRSVYSPWRHVERATYFSDGKREIRVEIITRDKPEQRTALPAWVMRGMVDTRSPASMLLEK